MLMPEGVSMGRLLTLLLGLLVVAGVTYYVLQRSAESQASLQSAPKQQLDRVRERSKEIERDGQKRADDAFKKSE
jgi:predicted HAD superfamily phosphohydrolase